MKDVARGSAAVAPLLSKETLSGAYSELRTRIDQIVVQAEQHGSLASRLRIKLTRIGSCSYPMTGSSMRLEPIAKLLTGLDRL